MPYRTSTLLAAALAMTLPTNALALDEAHYRTARECIGRAIEYLRSQQDSGSGGWNVEGAGGAALPGITAIVLNGMLLEPSIDAKDPAVRRGVAYILGMQRPDGGIYDGILASYNTSLCLSALSRVNTPEAAAAIKPAQDFLRSLQWSEAAADHPETNTVGRDSAFYGGIGYGSHSRPDNSNLQMMLQAMTDSGLDCNDEVYKRALVFLERTQMHHTVNDMAYAEGSTQGGFIYATGDSPQNAGKGESKAGMIEETLDDGTHVSRLRAYGSMTYAGFKSYIYAQLDRDDPRVQLAYDWIRRHYTLDENPGVGQQGLFYYFVTFSRALDAWGLPYIDTLTEAGEPGETRDWANDLIDRLAALQRPDGSFVNENDRWMEGDPVLVTAYALLALQHAIN